MLLAARRVRYHLLVETLHHHASCDGLLLLLLDLELLDVATGLRRVLALRRAHRPAATADLVPGDIEGILLGHVHGVDSRRGSPGHLGAKLVLPLSINRGRGHLGLLEFLDVGRVLQSAV